MTEAVSDFPFMPIPHNLAQIRIRCGLTYNRTVRFNERYILLEVTKCCDHCQHCLARVRAIETALMHNAAQYEFFTNAETLTVWVTIERQYGGDPLEYLRE